MRLSRVATIVPDVGGMMPAVALRRYTLVDRGSYEYADDVPEPPGLVAIASDLTGRTLRPVVTRLLRFSAGDYLLAHHDPLHADHRVEVVLDLSPVPAPCEVRWRRGNGAVFFRFPCTPGAAAIVERDPTTQAYHTYVSKLHRDASVVRLIVQLVDA